MVVFTGIDIASELFDGLDTCGPVRMGCDVAQGGVILLNYEATMGQPPCRLQFKYERCEADVTRVSGFYAERFVGVPVEVRSDTYSSYVGSNRYRDLMFEYYGTDDDDYDDDYDDDDYDDDYDDDDYDDDEEDDEGWDGKRVGEWCYTFCQGLEWVDIHAHGVVDDWACLETASWWSRRYVCAPMVHVDRSGDHADLELDVWNRLWQLWEGDGYLKYPGDAVSVVAGSGAAVYRLATGLLSCCLG